MKNARQTCYLIKLKVASVSGGSSTNSNSSSSTNTMSMKQPITLFFIIGGLAQR